MKKALVIGAIVVFFVLGTFIFLGKQTTLPPTGDVNGQPSSGIQEAIDTTRLQAKEASLKSFVAYTMVDVGKYYSDSQNTTLFSQNPSIKQSLETKLSALKEQYPGDYAYKIYEGKDFAFKVAEKTSGIYVCADSITIGVVNISSSEFSQQTDCTGQPIE